MGHCDGDGPWSRGLPEGWSAATDDTSGLTYYYNEQTRECTWERPLTAAVLDETTDDCCFLQGAGTENGDDGGAQAPALAVLMAMGFARDAAAAALSQAANDVERAAALLLDNALVSPQHLEVRPTLPVFHTRKPLRFLCARHLA